MVDSASEITLEIRDLCLSYNTRPILTRFSMILRKGETAGVWGESGAGKSSLLKCILGFVSPESGSIHILGQELNSRSVWTLRHHLGYVQQEPDPGQGTVADFLRFPLTFKSNRHLEKNWDRLGEILSALRLSSSLLDEKMTRLSGGEKQRISLISALLLEREIYLLDEITSALDEKNTAAVLEFLRSLKGVSILAVTHDRRVTESCDSVFDLRETREGAGE